MVCVGLSERDLLQWHDVTRKIWGGSGPPSSAPDQGFPNYGPRSHFVNDEKIIYSTYENVDLVECRGGARGVPLLPQNFPRDVMSLH